MTAGENGSAAPSVCPSSEAIASALARIRRLPVVDHLDLDIDLEPSGRSVVRLRRVAAHHLGGLEAEVLNGGIVLCLLDAAIASAALPWFDGRCGTVELSTQIARPVDPKAPLATGEVVHRAGRLAFLAAEIHDHRGELCVRASGIVAGAGKR